MGFLHFLVPGRIDQPEALETILFDPPLPMIEVGVTAEGLLRAVHLLDTERSFGPGRLSGSMHRITDDSGVWSEVWEIRIDPSLTLGPPDRQEWEDDESLPTQDVWGGGKAQINVEYAEDTSVSRIVLRLRDDVAQ